MKRYFFGLILTLLVVGLFADYLVQIDLPSSTTLQKQVKDLTAAGCEVFHYDSSSLIGKADDAFQVRYPQYNTRKLLPLPTYQRLYLISRIDDQAQLDLPPAYHILAELKDSWLVSSMQDEVQLRGEISHPFTVLELKPIVPQKKLSGIPEIRTLERSIEDLVSLVNPDSVMWFIQSLQNFQTRYAMAPNRLEVATWIRNQFIRFGITDAELSPFQWNGTTQYNVVATIPGTLNPDKYVIVGGHHDSIVNNGDPYTWAPGADDNASGSVAALEMARVMMQQGFQPKNSIRFLTFAAEEFGLWGSKDYAETALQSEQNILLMINHDMIAYTEQNPDNWQVRLMPYDGCDNHTTYASGLTQLYTSLNPTYGTYNSPSSDSHPFWARGYPVIYYFEQTFCPYYHSDLDIVDYVNPDYCAEIIRASTAVASTYANMPLAPENLSVSDAGTGGALQLSWSNVTDPFVTHYNVYHSIYGQNFTNPQQVTPTPGATTSFTLDNLDNGTLYYVALSSVDENGSESYYILGEGTPNLYPLMPTGFADQPGLGEVLFTWDRNQELDVHVYQIYRSTDPDNLGEVYAQVPQTGDPVISFLDADFDDSNQYYYYALNVLDLSGSTSPTTEIISSRPVTLNSGILVIDETADG
ncbi:MAG: M20/M25/M40 family metallo-hydrolase, partial [Candidatus Cloacimonetes bacterium]|nr:M20/M25/M40 family metallo-hydrolase [Candidatus Cloacimonadota bacterium]